MVTTFTAHIDRDLVIGFAIECHDGHPTAEFDNHADAAEAFSDGMLNTTRDPCCCSIVPIWDNSTPAVDMFSSLGCELLGKLGYVDTDNTPLEHGNANAADFAARLERLRPDEPFTADCAFQHGYIARKLGALRHLAFWCVTEQAPVVWG